jgi:hypothetical protein
MRAAVALTPRGITDLAERVSLSTAIGAAGGRQSWLTLADGRLAVWDGRRSAQMVPRSRKAISLPTIGPPIQSEPGPLLIGPGEVITVRRPSHASMPLYYRIFSDTVEIDDDLERLAASTAARSNLDQNSLLHFVWRGRPRPGRTLYVDICSLGVGEELVCSPGRRPVIRRFWWPLHGDRLPQDNEALCDEAFARIDAAVARATAGGLVTGGYQSDGAALLLSGGVDSSLIAALAHRRGVPLTAFTVAFDDAYGLNETPFARRVTRSLRIPHRVVRIAAEDVAPLLCRVLAAPQPRAAPAAITHAALIEAVAGAGHRRLVSGLGADECFGGYHKPLEYFAAQLHHMRRRRIDLAGLFEIPLQRLLRMREAIFFGVAEFFPLRQLARIACDTAAVRKFPVSDIEFYRGALAAKPNAHALELMAAHEFQYRLSELLLPAFGTEGFGAAPSLAYPFLNPSVYLWASALDPSDCYWHEDQAWWAKRLLRATAKRFLSNEIVMRKRQVFLAPFAHWLLARVVRAIIIEEIADSPFWRFGVLRRGLRETILAKLRRYHAVDSEDSWQEQLWAVLALCAWVNRRRTA